MKLKILKNKKEVANEVADLICRQVRRKSSSVFGLATGKTMIPVYAELVRRFKRGEISFSGVRTFNLDEYVGGDAMKRYMWRNFFGKVDVREENVHLLKGLSGDLKKECREFENAIKKLGGVDLQILGLGRNGHIGFNEPGSSFASRTRKIRLSEMTRRVNRVSSRFALTVGIRTILDAEKIVLAATGNGKAEIVRELVSGRISTEVPASVLQRTGALVVVDRAAAKFVNG